MDPQFARILKNIAKDFVNQTADHLFADKPSSGKKPQKSQKPQKQKRGAKNA